MRTIRFAIAKNEKSFIEKLRKQSFLGRGILEVEDLAKYNKVANELTNLKTAFERPIRVIRRNIEALEESVETIEQKYENGITKQELVEDLEFLLGTKSYTIKEDTLLAPQLIISLTHQDRSLSAFNDYDELGRILLKHDVENLDLEGLQVPLKERKRFFIVDEVTLKEGTLKLQGYLFFQSKSGREGYRIKQKGLLKQNEDGTYNLTLKPTYSTSMNEDVISIFNIDKLLFSRYSRILGATNSSTKATTLPTVDINDVFRGYLQTASKITTFEDDLKNLRDLNCLGLPLYTVELNYAETKMGNVVVSRDIKEFVYALEVLITRNKKYLKERNLLEQAELPERQRKERLIGQLTKQYLNKTSCLKFLTDVISKDDKEYSSRFSLINKGEFIHHFTNCSFEFKKKDFSKLGDYTFAEQKVALVLVNIMIQYYNYWIELQEKDENCILPKFEGVLLHDNPTNDILDADKYGNGIEEYRLPIEKAFFFSSESSFDYVDELAEKKAYEVFPTLVKKSKKIKKSFHKNLVYSLRDGTDSLYGVSVDSEFKLEYLEINYNHIISLANTLAREYMLVELEGGDFFVFFTDHLNDVLADITPEYRHVGVVHSLTGIDYN